MTWRRIDSKWMLALPLAVAVGFALGGCKGCPPDDDDTDGDVTGPTVEKMVERTRDAVLLVRGTKQPKQAVWVMLAHEDAAQVVVEMDGEDTWEGPVNLRKGTNEMTFFAEGPIGKFSRPVGPYRVTRDSDPPMVPEVDPYEAFRPLNGASNITVTLTGRKGADGNLLFAQRTVDGQFGAPEEKVPRDGLTTWSISMNLTEGSYVFQFSSSDDLGNISGVSEEKNLAVFGAIPPPTLRSVTSPTKVTPQRLSGTKPAGTALFLRRGTNDGAQEEAITPEDNNVNWNYNLNLEQGTNRFFLVAKKSSVESPAVEGTILFDGLAPECPVVDPYEPVVLLTGGSTSRTLSFTGTKEDGATLFMVTGGVEQQLPDTGPTWSVEVPNVPIGVFSTRFDAEDTLKNRSSNCPLVRVTVTDVVAPTMDPVTSPTDQTCQVIRGTKNATVSVYVKQSGSTDKLISADSTTSWQYNLCNLKNGENRVCVYARKNELVSPDECATIIYLTPLVVDPVVSPTRQTAVMLSGSKGAGQWVKARVGTQVTTILDATDTEIWTATRGAPIAEGSNEVIVFGGVGDLDAITNEVTVTVLRDTTPPAKPIIQAPASPTGNASITLNVTRDPDGDLRVRLNQNPPPTTATLPRGGNANVTVEVNLVSGTNHICLSSQDALGNDSGENCVAVVRTPGPALRFITPLANGMVSGQQVNVVVEATPDTTTQQPVTGVTVAIDSRPATNALLTPSTSQWTWSFAVPATGSEFANGTTHTLVERGENAAAISTEVRITVVYNNDVTLLSSTTAASESYTPRMAIDGNGVVHVVWADDCIQFGFAQCPESKSGNYPLDIFHRSYNPSTGNFSPIRLLSDVPGDGDSREPSLATDKDGNVHVVWVESGDVLGSGPDKDIVHRVVMAADGSFGDVEVLTTTDDNETNPAIAASANGNIHVVWDRMLDSHVIMYVRRDAGGVWTQPAQMSTNAAGDSRFPVVDGDVAGCAHIAWQGTNYLASEGGPDADIWYRKECASSVGTPVLVSDSILDGDSRTPSLVVLGTGTVAVVWKETGNIMNSGTDGDIWMRRITGGQLGDYMLVSVDSDAESFGAVITRAPGNNVVVAWSERYESGQTSLANVLYNVSINEGAYFYKPGTPATHTNGPSKSATVAVDQLGNMHLAWQDLGSVANSGTDTDIYYVGLQLSQ